MELGFRVSGTLSLIQLISFFISIREKKKKKVAYGTDGGYCPHRVELENFSQSSLHKDIQVL